MSNKEVVVHNEDSMEHVDSENEDNEKNSLQNLLNHPAYMTTIMRRQILHEMLKGMPKPVQDRVVALKNLQISYLELEAKFYEEVYQLERKYQDLYQPLNDQRKQIVTGEHEPTDVEKVKKYPEEEDEDEDEEVTEKMKQIAIDYPEDVKGIPEFWLTIFRCTDLLSQMVQKCDEPVLKKLIDIKTVYNTTATSPMSFTLEFYFEQNEFFTDTILTKQYFLKSNIDKETPFGFEGPEIFKCTGCVIHWNKGKNLTVKTIRKKQKHKARGAVRTITKQVPADSFFNFFNPPEPDESGNNSDYDTDAILATDFEIGHFLRSRVIPKATLFYTGDIVDDDIDDEEEEEEEEDEEDDDEDSEGDAPPPPKSGGGGMKNKKGAGGNPAECQQQ